MFEMLSPEKPALSGDFATEEDRVAAVRRRDASADGRFVYAVTTTGVYCRPICAARPALRENLRFFDGCDEAERAGFRACKRCRPSGPSRADSHAAAVAEACRAIDAAEDRVPSLAALAARAGMSPHHFHRVFKKIAGMTPGAYAAAQRARRVREELRAGGSVTEAIYGAGYNSSSRFYEKTDAMLGMTPTAYRDGGRGAAIRYAVRPSAVGLVLVAATERGICAIMFGESEDTLVAELRREFPRAEFAAPDESFATWVANILAFIEAPGQGLDLPLDVRGTAFQQRVWRALRDIPAGATISYAELARRIGEPGSARAVAQACASNHIAVAIPCHRVVRSDGALSGYRWGVERKRALLAREAAE